MYFLLNHFHKINAVDRLYLKTKGKDEMNFLKYKFRSLSKLNPVNYLLREF
jgi:hypothetical protein